MRTLLKNAAIAYLHKTDMPSQFKSRLSQTNHQLVNNAHCDEFVDML